MASFLVVVSIFFVSSSIINNDLKNSSSLTFSSTLVLPIKSSFASEDNKSSVGNISNAESVEDLVEKLNNFTTGMII